MKNRGNPHLIYLGRAVHNSVLIILAFVAISGVMLIGSGQLPWLGILLILPLPIALVVGEYLWIDEDQLVYRTAIVIFGKAFFTSTGPYTSIEHILIKKTRMSKTMSSRGTTTSFKFFEFDAYLQFIGAEPFYLFSSKDPKKIVAKVEPVSKELNIEVIQPDSWE